MRTASGPTCTRPHFHLGFLSPPQPPFCLTNLSSSLCAVKLHESRACLLSTRGQSWVLGAKAAPSEAWCVEGQAYTEIPSISYGRGQQQGEHVSGPDVMFGFRKGPRWEVVPELGWATSEVKTV